jgi:hypothetical protein
MACFYLAPSLVSSLLFSSTDDSLRFSVCMIFLSPSDRKREMSLAELIRFELRVNPDSDVLSLFERVRFIKETIVASFLHVFTMWTVIDLPYFEAPLFVLLFFYSFPFCLHSFFLLSPFILSSVSI